MKSSLVSQFRCCGPSILRALHVGWACNEYIAWCKSLGLELPLLVSAKGNEGDMSWHLTDTAAIQFKLLDEHRTQMNHRQGFGSSFSQTLLVNDRLRMFRETVVGFNYPDSPSQERVQELIQIAESREQIARETEAESERKQERKK